MNLFRCALCSFSCFLLASSSLPARDFFLTIGGGYSPSGNQASLEKNVILFQRLLAAEAPRGFRNDTYFADGDAKGRDLQVVDRNTVPKASRLMAEFFGSQRNLGLTYRNHQVADVNGSTSPENLRRWFSGTGQTMSRGDRLFVYVTSHGSESDDDDAPHDTSIALWNNRRIKVSEFTGLLDSLPEGIEVVAVMVQCHAGGFARFIYNEGNPDKGLATQSRCGFYATVHDRPAAGCTPEINEATYVEYSTYFWEAISGQSRTGKPVERPDYNVDGYVSFSEAHAYTVLMADTIDLPIKSSGEFLGVESLFANNRHPELLYDDADYAEVLDLATDSETAILQGLSSQLKLTGDDRIPNARRQGQNSRRGPSRGRRVVDPSVQLRQRIANDLKRRWPELANVLNPVATELLTDRREEFVAAVEGHRDYKKYRSLADKPSLDADPATQRVKYERFVRTAENVILRENLIRLKDDKRIAEYEAIVAAENGGIHAATPASGSQSSEDE